MTPSAFVRLYEAAADSARLEPVYDDLLSHLFRNPFWESGPIALRRVLWTHGERAKIEDAGTFASAGLYIWGVEERPLYVGITRSSFNKRFKRYIWTQKSQCNLAQQFEANLISNGMDGFPPDITEWYDRSFHGGKVRLNGSVRFAKEGIAKVWFTLFPHAAVSEAEDEIRALERALIPVAEQWNSRRGLLPLLNKQK